MFALVKAVILKMTILSQIQSLGKIRKFMQKNSYETYESFYKLDETIQKLNLKNARPTSLYDFFSCEKTSHK
ncbi:hypothetical protein HZS_4486 [Henneguya salminicola]|nr:hypothetical protein HZS_4486 [Henneguya salminicola]